MRNEKRRFNVAGILVSLLSGLVVCSGASAAGSYLQELEAEAASTDNSAEQAAPASTQNWSKQQTTASEKLDSGLSKPQFEDSLKNRFYGSYLFYSTLNDQKQQSVFQEYQKNSDIEYIREVIKVQMTN